MRFKALLGLWLVVLTTLASADGPDLTIGTNNTVRDRKTLELLSTEAFRRAGLSFRLEGNPSERSLALANEGTIDGEGLRVAGLEQQYPNLVQVPERYTSISFVAFARDASIPLDQGWASLKPHRIAFITGWKLFEANATNTQSVTKVDKPDQLFRMLDAGRIDLALYTLADGTAVVKGLGLSGIAPLSPSLREADMYLYLNTKHQAHVPRIAKALKDMKADGTYAKLMAQVSAP